MSTPIASDSGAQAFSGNEIKRLGNRLRDGGTEAADIEMLERWRESYDPLLISMSSQVDAILGANGFQFLLSGRSKRTKSILRKLKRADQHNMDLSRMSDVVGFRIILASMAEQDRAMQLLAGSLDQKKVYDYRTGDKPYRSVHVVVRDDSRFVEIQLRTLPQHVWAVESETFGEKVKEGTSPEREKMEYLEGLSKACAELDGGKDVLEVNYQGVPLFEQRLPISGLHNRLVQQFAEATQTYQPADAGKTFLVVFDNELRQLMHNDEFSAENRTAALERYRWLSHRLSDPLRFETLIFNSSSDKALAVTHPRFFE
jgi:ppGpp synthetase/RelA/SpoT-type nucleotidyltranferase